MVGLRTKVIACQTVGEELKPLLPDGFDMEVLEYGLHNAPEKLHHKLQEAIDNTSYEIDTILIGYGMCANAIIGIHSRKFTLVIPKVDDCITLYLGSREEYLRQLHQAPGTFYLTKGWIEHGEDPYTEYCTMREKYGHNKAYRVTKRYIINYTRLALINSGNYVSEAYRKYARMVSDYFGLAFEEIPGSTKLMESLLQGDWEKDFVLVSPGRTVLYDMFYAQDVNR